MPLAGAVIPRRIGKRLSDDQHRAGRQHDVDMKNLNNLAKLSKAALAATSSLWIFDVELYVKEARAGDATEQDLAERPWWPP